MFTAVSRQRGPGITTSHRTQELLRNYFPLSRRILLFFFLLHILSISHPILHLLREIDLSQRQRYVHELSSKKQDGFDLFTVPFLGNSRSLYKYWTVLQHSHYIQTLKTSDAVKTTQLLGIFNKIIQCFRSLNNTSPGAAALSDCLMIDKSFNSVSLKIHATIDLNCRKSNLNCLETQPLLPSFTFRKVSELSGLHIIYFEDFQYSCQFRTLSCHGSCT